MITQDIVMREANPRRCGFKKAMQCIAPIDLDKVKAHLMRIGGYRSPTTLRYRINGMSPATGIEAMVIEDFFHSIGVEEIWDDEPHPLRDKPNSWNKRRSEQTDE